MAWSLDARIPLLIVEDAGLLADGPPTAILASADAMLPAGRVAQERYQPGQHHAVACACCQGRAPAAVALDRLFQARVRGQCPWFERVVALSDSPAALRAALGADALTAARFRLLPGPPLV